MFKKNYLIIHSLFIAIVSHFAYALPVRAEHISLPKDSEGWTIFTPSVDTDVVYVDSDAGNDGTCASYRTSDPLMGANPFLPVGEIVPCATYAKAKTFTGNNQPDWILFKRGSVFNERIDSYRQAGRSASEPILISYYGSSGALPIILGGYANNGNADTKYVALMGLDFYSGLRDPLSPTYSPDDTYSTGVFLFAHATYTIKGVLVEGCRVRYFKDNINVGPVASSGNSGLALRRNVIVDAYSRSGSHSQGFYLSNMEDIFVEENVFDHNGWLVQNDNDGTSEAGEVTMFNHNMYQSSYKSSVIKNNVFMRPSSISVKNANYSATEKTTGLVIHDSLFVDGEIAVSIGASDQHQSYGNVGPHIYDNVFTGLGISNPTNRELAWFSYLFNLDGGELNNNYMLHQTNTSFSGHFFHLQYSGRNTKVHNNVIYNVKNITPVNLQNIETGNPPREGVEFYNNIFDTQTSYIVNASLIPDVSAYLFRNNLYKSTKAQNTWFNVSNSTKTNEEWQSLTGDNSRYEEAVFSDPARSIETYMDSIGETPTMDAFIEKARSQSRHNWDIRFTADVVNDWIRAGFSSSDTTPPSSPSGLSVL